MTLPRNNFLRFLLPITAVAACLSLFFYTKPLESSYLPVTGSNIGIGTSTPVGGFVIMNGNVGIGTWSPVGVLEVKIDTGAPSKIINLTGSFADLAGSRTGLYADVTAPVVGAGLATGSWSQVRTTANAGTYTSAISGAYDEALHSGNATVDYLIGALTLANQIGSGPVTNAYGLYPQVWKGAGTITNAYGLYYEGVPNANPETLDVSGTVVNQYGLAFKYLTQGTTRNIGILLDDVTDGTTINGNFGIFAEAGYPNYFAGNVGVGTWKPDGHLSVFSSGTTRTDNTSTDITGAFANESRYTVGQAGQARATPSDVQNFRFFAGSGAFQEVVQIKVNTPAMDGAAFLGAVDFYTQDLSGLVNRMSITNAGVIVPQRIGIGTTNPVGALAVMSGNVGIGTWSPVGPLEVRGYSSSRIWTGAGTSTNATAAGELYIEGDLEVDGTLYGDGSGLTGTSGITVAGGWTDGGTNVFTTTTSDNVGIGTTTPTSTLEVVKTAAGTSPLMVSTTATSDGDIFVITSDGNTGVGTASPRSGLVVMSGNVGIGTTAAVNTFAVGPASQFQVSVAGGIAASTSIATSGGYTQSGTDANTLTGTTTFSNATTAAVFSTGNVGIGTTSPSVALLNVNGETYIAGPVGIGTFTPTGMMDIRQDEVRIWTGAGTSTNATTAGELYVEGDLEVDGTLYGDGSGLTGTSGLTVAGGWTDGGTNVYTTTTTDLVAIGTITPVSALTVKGNIGIGTTTPYTTIAAPSNGMIVEGNVGIGTFAASSGKLVVLGGNVGIGTVAPGTALDISGDIRLGSGDHIFFSNSTSGGIRGTSGFVALQTDVADRLVVDYNGDIRFLNQANNRSLVFTDGGNLGIGTMIPVGGLAVMNGNTGIGTWSPIEKLQVIGTVNATAFVGDGSGLTNLPSGASGWTDGGTNVYTSTTTDNVSIGTTTPTAKLDVRNGGGGIEIQLSDPGFDADLGFLVGGSSAWTLYAENDDSSFRFNRTGALGDVLTITSSGNVGIGTFLPVGGLSVMSGNVGIGTWSPTQRLQVIGTVNASAFVGDGSGLTNLPGGSSGWTDGGTNVYTSTTTDMVAIGTTTPVSTLTVKGNVGIGTTLPYQTIAAPVNGMVVEGNVGIGTFAASTGKLLVTGGNVGIGTPLPSSYVEIRQPNSGGNMPPAFRLIGGSSTSGNGVGSSISLVAGDGNNTGTGGSVTLQTGTGDNGGGATILMDGGNFNGANITLTPGEGTGLQGGSLRLYGGYGGNSGFQYGGNVEIEAGAGNATYDGGNVLINGGDVDGSGNRGNVMIANLWGNVGIGTDMTSASAKLSVLGGNVGVGTIFPVGGLTVMNGNVGIGTWSPTARLQVIGTVNATAFVGDGSGLTNLPGGASGWTDGGTNVYTSTTTDMVGIGTTTPSSTLEIVQQSSTSPLMVSATASGDGNYLIITSSGNVGVGTTQPRGKLIVANGNIGIGTTSPQYALEITENAETAIPPEIVLRKAFGQDWYSPNFIGQMSSGTLASPGDVVDGWDIVRFVGEGWANSGYLSFGWISIGVDGTPGFLNAPGAIRFYTTPDGSSAPALRMTVRSNGSVGIGTAGVTDGLSIMSGNVGIGTWSSPANRLSIVGNIGIGTTLPYRRISAPNNGMVVEGNVGIGTWNPTANLDVFGHMRIRTPPAGNDALYILYPGTGTGVVSYRPDQGFSVSGTTDFSPVLFSLNRNNTSSDFFAVTHTTSGDRLMVKNSGNVGIGTTNPVGGLTVMNGNVGIGTWSPTARLQVIGTVNATAFVGDGSGLTGLPAGGGWTDGGTNVYTSTTTDNVGIGTTTPTSTLEVVKTASGTAPFMVSSTAIADGNLLSVSSVGNVGIGTNSPGGALVVMNGNLGIGTISPQFGIELVYNGADTAGTGALSIDARNSALNNEAVFYVRTPDTGLRKAFQFTSGASSTSWASFEWGALNKPGLALGDGSSARDVFIYRERADVMAVSPTLAVATNIGIGTVNPVSRLAVNGGVVIGTISVSSFINSLAPHGGLIVEKNVGLGTIAPVGALTVMSGNVGIGTWSPTSRLQVIGTVAATAFVGDGSGLTGLPAGGGWTDGGTNVYTSTTTDLVAIGTTTPASTLTLAGNLSLGTTLPYRTIAATNNGMAIEGNVGIGTWSALGGKLIVMGGGVGIGTLAPSDFFEVSDPAAAGSRLSFARNGGGGSILAIQDSGDNPWKIWQGHAPNALGFYYDTNGNPTLHLDSSGNVGIGDFSQDARLYVANGNVGIGTATPVNGTAIMNGNLGIGTWNPGTRLQVGNTASFVSEYDNGTQAVGFTVDWNNGNKQRVTLGAAGLAVTFTAPSGGVGNLMLKIIQDGSGSRTITSWPGTVRWPGGTAPTLTTTAGAVDIVTCYYDRTNYFCTNSLDFQ